MKLLVAVLVIFVALDARGDTPAMRELSGRVLARDTNIPLEGAVVYVAGSNGYHVLTTDNAGAYKVTLRAGTYNLVFAYGKSRSHASVTLTEHDQKVDGKVETTLGNEVSVIEEKLANSLASMLGQSVDGMRSELTQSVTQMVREAVHASVARALAPQDKK
jgi:hypothetical protein